jgi:hypothetical protein
MAIIPCLALILIAGCGPLAPYTPNEKAGSHAVGGLRTINTANITYASTYPHLGFPATLRRLGAGHDSPCMASEEQACLIDRLLAEGKKDGYEFQYFPGRMDDDGITVTYSLIARPIDTKKSGTRTFYSDGSGVIRYMDGSDAGPHSQSLD